MEMKSRVVGVCAAVAVALAGGAAAPAVAEASTPTGFVKTELGGICGTLFGAGISVAGFAREVVARGAGYAGAIVAAGCLLKDGYEYQQAWYASPAGRAEYRKIQAEYGRFRTEELMSAFGCTVVAVPPVGADDISTYERTTWNCSSSPYAKAD